MLRREPNARALRSPKHDRHFGFAAQHEAGLRGLIDDRIGHQRDKIPKLRLDDHTFATHGRTHPACRNDPFRNRCVAHAVRAEAIQKPGRKAEYAASGADIFAQDDDIVIRGHLKREGLRDGLGIGDPSLTYRGFLEVTMPRRQHAVHSLCHVRFGLILGPVYGGLDLCFDLGLHGLKIVRCKFLCLDQAVSQPGNRVAGFPILLFIVGAIGWQIGPHRMIIPAIGQSLYQRGPVARTGPQCRALYRVKDGRHIIAVDPFIAHVVAIPTRRD